MDWGISVLILDHLISSNVVKFHRAESCDTQGYIDTLERAMSETDSPHITHVVFKATNEGMQEKILQSAITAIEYIHKKYPNFSPRIYMITGAWHCEKTQQEIDKYLEIHCSIKIVVVAVGYWSSMYNNNINSIQIPPPPQQPRPFNFLCYNKAGKWFRSAIVGCLKNVNASMIYSHYEPQMPQAHLVEGYEDVYNQLCYDQEVQELNYAPGYARINYEHHANTNLSIITESNFMEHVNILGILITEKTIRTLLAQHPFIMVSKSLTLQSLREQGFKTFHGIIDESYDLIEDDVERLLALYAEIQRLNNFTEAQWIDFREQCSERSKYNYDHLLSLWDNDTQRVNLTKFTGYEIYE